MWYEARRRGLGDSFLSAIGDCLDRVSRDPQLYAVQDDRVRRARVRRFPFWIYFVLRADRVDVLAVYHQRRKLRKPSS
ncbi:MAG: type II toxin-antitoxin system RelE/ParE family toxin [Myxococcota bacterium]